VGRRYTISLLVNYTFELRSFCDSMLHSNNACRKQLTLCFIRERKIFNPKAMVTCKKSAAVVKTWQTTSTLL